MKLGYLWFISIIINGKCHLWGISFEEEVIFGAYEPNDRQFEKLWRELKLS